MSPIEPLFNFSEERLSFLQKDRIFTTGVLHPFINKTGGNLADERLSETVNLAEALNADVVWQEKIKLRSITPATIFGSGTVKRLKNIIEEKKIELIVINGSVTASQQRNLEEAWHCRVLDRTGLILAIFASRARTKEGLLQVELAALMYQKSRLMKSWTHLERQRGSLSFVGGPGETQLELDRRLLEVRIKKLKKEMEKVDKTRKLQRKSRQKSPYPIVSLVGYTNAGKSTLFNKLTGANVHVEDQVFATLDPTMRLLSLPSGKKIILSDTVGFISDIPTQLIASFKSTLDDILESTILLHIIDIEIPHFKTQYNDVQKVLKDINVNTDTQTIVDVYNKVDTIEGTEAYKSFLPVQKEAIFLSASTGQGCQKLLQHIDKILTKTEEAFDIILPLEASKETAWLHNHTRIHFSDYKDTGIHLKGHISTKDKGQFKQIFPKINQF